MIENLIKKKLKNNSFLLYLHFSSYFRFLFVDNLIKMKIKRSSYERPEKAHKSSSENKLHQRFLLRFLFLRQLFTIYVLWSYLICHFSIFFVHKLFSLFPSAESLIMIRLFQQKYVLIQSKKNTNIPLNQNKFQKTLEGRLKEVYVHFPLVDTYVWIQVANE